MKVELIGHDEKYALEQSLLTLFPGEKPVYGTVDETADAHWVRVTLTEEDERVQVTTELGMDGKSAAHSYDYPLSGTEYEKEGQRRHAVGISFFGAAKDLLGISPAWGSLTGVRPSKVALSLIREGGKKRAEKELQELYCVTPARARLAIEAADAGIRAAAELEPNDISLYVGIPFCPTRCAYCSFVAQSVEKSFSLVEPYLEALFDEITAAGQLVRELGLNVKSFYMGGGTPTTLTADQMDRLLTKLEQNFDFGGLAELTIEAGRPDTIDEEKLRVLRAHNTTRVSINPQTMEDNVLAAIGRRHTADDIRRAMEQVRAAGFPHVNMDLIAGLPGDTVEGFERSLRQAIALDPENITVHTLTLKRASRIVIEDQRENDYADVAAMLERCHLLAEAGYRPYYLYRQKNTLQNLENVGWCKPGHEGYYNIYIMEEVQTILSAGAGGSTKLVADGGKRMQRIFNFKYPTEYIQRFAEVLERKKGVADFYDHDLGPETSGGDRPL